MDEIKPNDAILRELWRRNALRREAKLPLIDIGEELDRALHRRAVNDFYAARKALDHLRPHLEEKWIARRRLRDPGYIPNHNTIWCMMAGTHVTKVPDRILWMRTGRVHPEWSGKVINYGEDTDDVEENV
ncbi:hypothetical protein [Azospirillum sp. TSO5]|uniref:hypothetical protein n=1 Tax=Azospirillum sp. TSO5 TaxID=716760 RepID=UPI000D655176|nr:hypothetical protein [Azospirillum sp. TSO5]